MDQKKGKGPTDPKKGGYRLRLHDVTDEEKPPDLAVYAVDRSYRPLHVAPVGAEGSFNLPDDARSKSHLLLVGPRSESPDLREGEFLRISPDRLGQAAIDISRKQWLSWIQVWRCVGGSVRHCRFGPWIYADLLTPAALQATSVAHTAHAAHAAQQTLGSASSISIHRGLEVDLKLHPHFPYNCDVVCDGLVEVYRRTCCCKPWIIYDPRLPELIRELEEIPIPPIPPIPPIIRWPPPPEPPPFHDLELLKEGALDQRILNAPADLQALRLLPAQEKLAYIQARPYLWCHRSCGTTVKVAQGFLDHDGEFHICWQEPLRLFSRYCHDEYAFIVKQNINGATVVIYNGLAANQWFDAGEDADLTSYHPQARRCRHNDFPGEGAFVLLQDIGDTGTWQLATPDATGWDRVAAPAYNSGLLFPAPSAAAALGQMRNCNLGGTLALRYHFSEPMRGLGARFYRVSVSAADAMGNPTGARTYLDDPVSWLVYRNVGTDIHVESEPLGPNTVGTEPHLFRIPYDADEEWQSGQYHALLDTTRFARGRFLLTLEVFNAAGQRMRPAGTPDPGGSVAAAFTFRRWYQQVGPTANVPFGALTHMLWWDNRSAQAQLVDLRQGGEASTETCQFLEGAGDETFSTGYRAYHPEPAFHLYHRIYWKRGLGWEANSSGVLTSPEYNPNNAGAPPDPVGVSGTATFAAMLQTHAKCSFALHLYTWVKTHNGSSRLSGLDASDLAAFALEIG